MIVDIQDYEKQTLSIYWICLIFQDWTCFQKEKKTKGKNVKTNTSLWKLKLQNNFTRQFWNSSWISVNELPLKGHSLKNLKMQISKRQSEWNTLVTCKINLSKF